ncbi:hypothetical protein GCM10010466_29230 [Planomonospora alba]|uniref:Uncharacterized protein n=1 Tax=Planomonospora alba TaxID=161354 RepID=A0ABP6N581_9ACTN
MPRAKLAKVVNVTSLPGGYFSFTIDGEEFPWLTQGLSVSIEPGDKGSSITITIPANRVEVIRET